MTLPRLPRVPRFKGNLSPPRTVPQGIPRPPYARRDGANPIGMPPSAVHTSQDTIQGMRDAAKVARDVLAFAGEFVQPGRSTDEIDEKVHNKFIEQNVYPAPLTYMGFPKSVCISVNNVICHGIPDDVEVQLGDIVAIDVTCYVNGYFGDNCRTFIASDTDAESKQLMYATKKSLVDSIEKVGPGVELGVIGTTIDEVVSHYGYGIVREYQGHGIGTSMHTKPLVKHFRNSDKFVLEEGMTFTIEPMITEGSGSCYCWSDGWTIATRDDLRSAQYEHTVLVTNHGAEVLTAYEGEDVELQKLKEEAEDSTTTTR
eukprot:gb/GECG01014750.1/.p1 GENE.gb/GECG01014750.1/~~gb/GECG01014750.1/.p1  ORF type:complete len:314 (+),score=39.17 gb/GECG01014750.1/:1-942(+)